MVWVRLGSAWISGLRLARGELSSELLGYRVSTWFIIAAAERILLNYGLM